MLIVMKTAIMFKQGIDAKAFGDKLLNAAMYSSNISHSKNSVNISLNVSEEQDGQDNQQDIQDEGDD